MVKLLVLYPKPVDTEAFDKSYEAHLALGAKKLVGALGISSSRVLGAPAGVPAYFRVSEVRFPSIDVLQACAASEGARETFAHAASISTGGAPVFLVVAEE